MPGEALNLKPEPNQAEPVFVFGTDLGGRHESDSAKLAVSLYQAEAGKGSGASGNAYAVPYRNSQGKLLTSEIISNYLASLFNQATEQPDTRFHVARFGCEPGAHDDAVMARLFARAPANCQVPGLWQRILDPALPVRLLLFDPGAHMQSPEWRSQLERYLALNAPLWDAPGVELVSVGSARAVVANDAAAKALGLRHRVIGTDEARYGRNAVLVAEARAIWYATHLLSIFDFDQTAQPQHIRVVSGATRNGLAIDQIDTKVDS